MLFFAYHHNYILYIVLSLFIPQPQYKTFNITRLSKTCKKINNNIITLYNEKRKKQKIKMPI